MPNSAEGSAFGGSTLFVIVFRFPSLFIKVLVLSEVPFFK
jgi:hypothetical protein